MKKSWAWIIGIVLVVAIIGILYVSNQQKSNEIINVGAVLPMSGYASFHGTEMQKGLDMCNPGNINYIYEDSAGAATTGVTAYNKLNQIDNVDITIIGMSAVVPAILPIAKENGDFVIASIVSVPDVGARGGDTVFRYFTDGAVEANILADFIVNKKEIRKLGMMYLNAEFGQIYKNSMQEFFDENGATLYSENFASTDSDFSTQLLKLKEKGVEGIFIAAYDKQSLQIMKQIKELGLNVTLFTEWVMANPEFHKGNEKIMEGIYFTTPLFYFSEGSGEMKFNGDYLAKYGKSSNIYAAIGCDLSKMIGDNNLKDYTQLEDLKVFDGINGKISQQENGEFIFPLEVVQFVNGSVMRLG